MLDKYYDYPESIKVHPDENVYHLINHLVKFTEFDEKLKHIQLKNEKLEDQYHMIVKWWNHLLSQYSNGYEISTKTFVNWLQMKKIVRDIREADEIFKLIGEQSTLHL